MKVVPKLGRRPLTLADPCEEIAPFPENWPPRPILKRLYKAPHFFGVFRLEMHPQDLQVPFHDHLVFGIKNKNTEKYVQYSLEYDMHSDISIERLDKADKKIHCGVIKPGEIEFLRAVHRNSHQKHYGWKRNLKLTYCYLESKAEVKEAKKAMETDTREVTFSKIWQKVVGGYKTLIFIEPRAEPMN